ncbi:MAG: polysaccharide deacetylase family protein [Desulfobacterales bacterium]|nr:polysaccharide deacetylase family protein [Desulfobacterales bacterium]
MSGGSLSLIRKGYSLLRGMLPLSGKASLTKLVYVFSGKPFVKDDKISIEDKFPNKERGGAIFSADFEMAWAFRFTKEATDPYEFALKKARQERANLPLILKKFEEHGIPVTWATVGHLFLESCQENTHGWMKKMPHFTNRFWQFTAGDWFDHDPYSNFREAPEWYAPDLIKAIRDSRVKHEFATHTFSHIDFSDKNCPVEVADDEIKASLEAINSFGLPGPVSICFPSGSWGNVPVLKKYGITIYRRKLKEVQLAYPYYDDLGLLVTLSSDAFDRSYPSWSSCDYQKRYMKTIDKAIKTNTIAHFVFHPSMDPWMINEVLPKVLGYAAAMRSQGKLWIGTMGEISRHIRSKKSST